MDRVAPEAEISAARTGDWPAPGMREPMCPGALARTAAVAVFAAVTAVGCHEQVQLPAPEWADQRAYLLAVTVDGEPTRLIGVDVAVEASGGPALSLSAGAELVAIHFACPLSALRLPAGEVELRREEADEVPLPRALGLQQLQIGGGASSDWQTIASVPAEVIEALKRLPVEPLSSECERVSPRLAVESIPVMEARGRAAFGMPLRSGEYLVGTALDRYFVFNADGTSRLVTVGDGVGPFVAGYEAPDGELWLLARDGRLVSGRIGGPWTVATSSVPIAREVRNDDGASVKRVVFADLAGPDRTDVPFELFAATDERTLAHYDGITWTNISVATRPDSPGGVEIRPQVIWLAPGEAVASNVGTTLGDVVWTEDARIDREDRLPLDDGVSSLQRTADGGLFLGTVGGDVYANDGTTWSLVGRTDRVIAAPIIDYEDGLLVGSVRGALGVFGSFEWSFLTDERACPIPPANLPVVVEVWQIGRGEWMCWTIQSTNDGDDFGALFLRAERSVDAAPCPGGTVEL